MGWQSEKMVKSQRLARMDMHQCRPLTITLICYSQALSSETVVVLFCFKNGLHALLKHCTPQLAMIRYVVIAVQHRFCWVFAAYLSDHCLFGVQLLSYDPCGCCTRSQLYLL